MASSWVDKRSSQNINITGKENANKFSRHVSDLADGYEKFDCASFSVGVNGCEQEDKCEDTRDSGPAGYFILNSFTSIHTTFKGLWQTVDKVENGMQSKLEQLVETFAPDVDESNEFNLIADFLGIAVGMFAAPLFNKSKLLKRNLYFMKTKDSPTADIKDLIANTASWGATLAKDIQNSKRETPKSKVAGKLSEISDLWTESIEAFTEKAFRGGDESVDYIGDLIADGKFNNDEVTFDMSDLRKQLRKVFFAVLIPEAWKVGAGYAPAFVMDSGYDCNAVGPLDYEYIAPSTGEEMGYCYQGRRAVEGWKANKEKNGGGFLDLTKTSNYDFLLDDNSDEVNIRLPGFIQIPYGGHNGNWNLTAHGGSKPSPNGGSNSGSKCGSSGGSQTSSNGGSSSGSSFGSNQGPNGSIGGGSKDTQPSIVPGISWACKQAIEMLSLLATIATLF
ncbi:hypothetical protein FOZG_06487 [Fusarium oxysporum Fo47]|uniref:Uncharacterized protein n=1 Tax=Fusarium oxysporum Fo47 TaxID=660027 RepID=W9KE99_FUSOX|nr:hypothetical protein FOZG_06487 [Fusarium oxysporum Fo47]